MNFLICQNSKSRILNNLSNHKARTAKFFEKTEKIKLKLKKKLINRIYLVKLTFVVKKKATREDLQ